MDRFDSLHSFSNLLQISTKKGVFSHLSGEHTTPFSGNGLDFKELREYTTGDDIRHINWKVTARSRNPVVNVFNEDKQLNLVFVYLNSGGLYFGSHRSKQDVALEVFGNLLFSGYSKKDTISSVFIDHKNTKYFPPSNNKVVLEESLKYGSQLSPLGAQIDFKKMSEFLLSSIKQKSIIFLIGDFLELPELKLLSSKHELYTIIVRDRFEEDLRLFGEFNLISPDTFEDGEILLDEAACKKYNLLLKEHDTKLISHLKKLKIKHTKIYTHENIIPKLKGVLL
jgi:uncharacterized protein (DUF58 family)